jgi:hypothetical protein
MARHRLDRRRIKIHRNYTVEEIARLLGTCRATVRRWLKKGLKSIDGHRPTIVRGIDLLEYLNARVKPKKRCPLGHCYCVKCRTPQFPAGSMAELNVLTATTGNMRALCPACGTLMHRRISLAQLNHLRTILDVTITGAARPLKDTFPPSPNVHLKEHAASDEV